MIQYVHLSFEELICLVTKERLGNQKLQFEKKFQLGDEFSIA